jgi:hypothetical protein
MTTSYWNTAAWRRGSQSTVTVTLQVWGARSASGCCSERSGSSRPDSPSFPSCPRRATGGTRSSRRFAPPSAAGRVCAARVHCPNGTGAAHRRSWRNGRTTTRVLEPQQNPGLSPLPARQEGSCHQLQTKKTSCRCTSMRSGDFLGRRRRGRLGRPERGDRCGHDPFQLIAVLNAST